MNPVHLHLALNHVAVVGIPIALLLALRGFFRDGKIFLPLSYKLVVALALITLVVYLTGEPTEEAVEHLTGISEKLIEPHEDAATVALVLTLLSGCLALVGLVFSAKEKLAPTIHKALTVCLLLASGSLAFTALQGGKIHHEEIRDSNGVGAGVQADIGGEEDVGEVE